ncbi:hypothetical protein ABLE43_02640 [Sphingomonas sp. VNH70]
MLAALILGMQTPVPAPVPVATPEDEIVVLGRKLRSTKFHYTTRKWKLRTCRVTNGPVDPVLQTAACEAIGWCVDQRRGGKADIGACISERRPEMLDRIAELRAAKP